MPTRYPLPDTIDSSMLSAFKACPQKFYDCYVRRLVPKGINIHLLAGGAFARGLEVARRAFHEQERSPDEALAIGLAALWQAYGDPPVDEKEKKTWDRLSAAYESYFAKYSLDGDWLKMVKIQNQPAIEFTFCFPIPEVLHPITAEPILFSGRADWIGQYESLIYVVDEKTTGSFGMGWAESWELWSQFCAYVYAARYYGIDAKGAFVRGTAILKESIQHEHTRVDIPDWKLQRWYDQTVRDLNRMILCWLEDYWDMDLADACKSYGGCPYAELCRRKNQEPWIPVYYELNEWNPLKKHSPFLQVQEVER